MKEIKFIDNLIKEIMKSNLKDDSKNYLFSYLKGLSEYLYENMEDDLND